MRDAPMIQCPKCGASFALDETLAGPMIAKIREEADQKLEALQQQREADKEEAKKAAELLAKKERDLSDREAAFHAQLNAALAKERIKIAEEERANARNELAPDLEASANRIKTLEADLNKSRTAELALLQEKQTLEERTRNLDLEVMQKVNAERKAIQEQVEKAESEKSRLRELEYEKKIQDMREKIAEAERKATQGSQQLQGDVLEIDFEAALRQAFPQDTIAPVKAGVRGGDILQHVLGEMGRPVGTMFWEIKRTSAWSDAWVAKAKKDAADAKAEVVIIASDNLPKDIREFGLYDGVWVVRPTYGVMLAAALRQGVVNVSEARQRALGKETKAERLYEYMMGPEFRAMLEGIALPFMAMKQELIKEQTSTISRWRRQEKRLEQVLTSVAGLKGDLQGIGGMDMLELPGFEEEVSDISEESIS